MSNEFLCQIPPLDVNHPPEIYSNRSLVSFRAMVQDTSLSPEIYLSRKADGTCGGWGLGDCDETNDYTLLKECTVVWAVSIPGESPWCSHEANGTNHTLPFLNVSEYHAPSIEFRSFSPTSSATQVPTECSTRWSPNQGHHFDCCPFWYSTSPSRYIKILLLNH